MYMMRIITKCYASLNYLTEGISGVDKKQFYAEKEILCGLLIATLNMIYRVIISYTGSLFKTSLQYNRI